MDKTRRPASLGNEDAGFETAIKESVAEAVGRSQEGTANEQAGIKHPKSKTRARAEKIDEGDGAGDKPKRHTPQLQLSQELLEEVHKIRKAIKAGSNASHRGRLIATIGVIATIIIGVAGLWININRRAAGVVRQLEQDQLTITSPQNGESVGLGQKVRGNTPFLDMNHYIVLTMASTGALNIQKEPAHVNPTGAFSGEARFGDKTIGEDDEFRIQVFATRATGTLLAVPEDAIFSEPVTVRRVKSLSQPVITAPKENAEVSFNDKILGTTSWPSLKHNIVVTPVEGTAYVQDQPATVNDDGTFIGTARFGGANVGVGEQFVVRILATESTLPAGSLTVEPVDAVVSNSVTVRRKK